MYTVLWGAVGVGLVVALFLRSPIDVSVTPVRNPLYVTLSDGTIRNTYDIRLRNKSGEDKWYWITLTAGSRFAVTLESEDDAKVLVPANETYQQRVYVEALPGSEGATEERSEIRLWIANEDGTERVSHDTVFNGKAD